MNGGVIIFCPNCGCENKENAKYCLKCGKYLNDKNFRQFNKNENNVAIKSNDKKPLLIISVTLIIIGLIVVGTFLIISGNDYGFFSDNNKNNDSDEITVNLMRIYSAKFYSDGNPNTGETVTINVGKEQTGKSIGVMTLYSRDGVRQNYPEDYEYHTVNENGEISITDYTAMPKYPDHCTIYLKYENQISQFESDIGKYKGSQTTVPVEV